MIQICASTMQKWTNDGTAAASAAAPQNKESKPVLARGLSKFKDWVKKASPSGAGPSVNPRTDPSDSDFPDFGKTEIDVESTFDLDLLHEFTQYGSPVSHSSLLASRAHRTVIQNSCTSFRFKKLTY